VITSTAIRLPSFSPLPPLDDAQKQALKNWQALGFPEHSMPPIYSFSSTTLDLPKVYLKDANGDIVQKISAEMALIPNQQTIQFELIDFHEVDESEGEEHVHQ